MTKRVVYPRQYPYRASRQPAGGCFGNAHKSWLERRTENGGGFHQRIINARCVADAPCQSLPPPHPFQKEPIRPEVH